MICRGDMAVEIKRKGDTSAVPCGCAANLLASAIRGIKTGRRSRAATKFSDTRFRDNYWVGG